MPSLGELGQLGQMLWDNVMQFSPHYDPRNPPPPTLANPPQKGPGYQDILNMQAMRNPRVQSAMQAGQAMQDPRALAFAAAMAQEQPKTQVAQQQPQQPYSDPMSGMIYGQPPQQAQMAQPQPDAGRSWADAFYELIRPGMGGGSYGSQRY